MLQKPGKPCYDIPKAYQPIALLNTVAKLLYSIVAEEITHMVEKHQLLPANHFGGQPGQSTTDSLHLLVNTVKVAWRQKQVVAVLFLDIKGAFPNAVTTRLLHNLRKWHMPEEYVAFIANVLTRHRTKLKFDNRMSE